LSKTVLVCQHQTCPKQGAVAVLRAFRSNAPSDVVVKSVGCLGECGNGPMVVILPEEVWYCHVALEDVPKIVEQHLKGGKPVKAKLYRKFHPDTQSFPLWLTAFGLGLGFLGLFFWLLARQTYYF
jgi:(2Fe-2S) ferredoxin